MVSTLNQPFFMLLKFSTKLNLSPYIHIFIHDCFHIISSLEFLEPRQWNRGKTMGTFQSCMVVNTEHLITFVISVTRSW